MAHAVSIPQIGVNARINVHQAQPRQLPSLPRCSVGAVRSPGRLSASWTGARRPIVAIKVAETAIMNGSSKLHIEKDAIVEVSSAPAVPAPPAAAAAAVTPEPTPGIVAPPKAYEIIVGMGAAKAVLPWQKIFIMGIVAGVYIGFGGLLALTVGGNCPGLAASNPGLHRMVYGAFGLPVGLVLVLCCGAELFTGNVAAVSAAMVEGKANMKQLAKSWGASFAGNLVGTTLLVGIVAATGLMATAQAPVYTATAKTSLTFVQAFTRGILCNFMVCLGLWMASASNSFPGKFLAAWVPVSAFTAIGFEHSIANAFMVPMGIAVGAPVSLLKFFFANLLPVTLGNIVGGLALSMAYAYAYGSLGGKVAAWWEKQDVKQYLPKPKQA